MLPEVRGDYSFSGVDMVAQSPPDWSGQSFQLPVKVGEQGGQVGPTQSITQIPLGLDLPFLRLVVAPGLTGESALDMLQVDALYKHPVATGSGKVRAMLGLSWVSLQAKVGANYTLALQNPVNIGSSVIQNGDKVAYTASESRTGWFVAAGLEYALAPWAHAFVQVQGRFSKSASREEDLVITARHGSYDNKGQIQSKDFHVLDDPNFIVSQKQKGVLTAQFDLPPATALVGISVTWPSWEQLTRRSLPGPSPAPPAPAPAPPPHSSPGIRPAHW